MRAHVKLTRPELKKNREALARTALFLPMLELKQRLLQHTIVSTRRQFETKEAELTRLDAVVEDFQSLTTLPAGLDMDAACRPVEVVKRPLNIAGIELQLLIHVEFPASDYDLLGTEPWVDEMVDVLREREEIAIAGSILRENLDTLIAAWLKITQRINLFEKLIIPRHKEAIHKIRVFLGDEQTAGVGRAKQAAGKIRRSRGAKDHL